MRRIGISQRIEPKPERSETWDVLDQRLAGLIAHLGFLPVPLCTLGPPPQEVVQSLDLSGILLSGGQDVGAFPARDALEMELIRISEASGLPLLGICRGLQVINLYYGGRLDPVDGHVCSRHSLGGELGRAGQVNSFHRLGVLPDGLAVPLVGCAIAADGSIEALRHPEWPCLGIMWHPERDSPWAEEDLDLIGRHFAAGPGQAREVPGVGNLMGLDGSLRENG